MDKAKRGRPRLTREEKESGLAKTKDLAREVRGASGLSVAQLLARMSHYGVMSGNAESLWRKYEAGIAAMSPDRLHNVAMFAWAHSWAGDCAWRILSQAGQLKHAERSSQEETRTRELLQEMQAIFEKLLPGEIDGESIRMLDMLILKARNEAIDRARLISTTEEIPDELIAAIAQEEYENSFFVSSTPGSNSGFGYTVQKPKWLKGKKIDH